MNGNSNNTLTLVAAVLAWPLWAITGVWLTRTLITSLFDAAPDWGPAAAVFAAIVAVAWSIRADQHPA
jgi:hypothetical protein